MPTRKYAVFSIVSITLFRLLSDRGFRYLRGHQPDLDPEADDLANLDKLMLYYREWAHYLFPEMKFADFIAKTRRECSSKLMKQYLADLRRSASGEGGPGTTAAVDDFSEFDAGFKDILGALDRSKELTATAPSIEAEEDELLAAAEAMEQDAKENFADFDLGDGVEWSDKE